MLDHMALACPAVTPRRGSEQKLDVLGGSAQFDLCGTCGGENRIRAGADRWIYPAARPDGRTVRLLKTLMSNVCRNDCRYCALRSSRGQRRASYDVEELTQTFTDLWRARLAEGLFLSSAVPGDPDATMGRMVAVAETLRRRYGFRGYIHLKVLPGSSRASIEAAGRVADRISVNLEAPSAARLACLAPDKDWTTDLRRRMEWVAEVVKDPAYRARSHTTQFVVGAGGESDRELLRCVWDCYRGVGLDRAYFSAYQPPDRDAPAPATAANLLTREHRLYQADWLVRRYGFAFDELPFDPAGGLDPVKDPKQVWADRHPDFFPVEVNRAEYGALLRVPGIGPTGASRIVKERRAGALRRVADLARLGVVTQRAAAYVLLDGRQPLSGPRQQTLWAS